jgi:hypothetical protein
VRAALLCDHLIASDLNPNTNPYVGFLLGDQAALVRACVHT